MSKSTKSKGPALLHKIKNQQRKIKAKATAFSNLIGHTDIKENPKAVARAGVVWSQIDVSRCQYQAILDKAFETLDGDACLAEAMVEDEKQWDWLTEIEAKLEELMSMRVSPEKGGGASANTAFMEDKRESAKPPVMTWKKDIVYYKEFLQLQTAANLENENKFREQEEKAIKLQKQLDNMRSTKSGNPVTDPKSAMRLPTCPPPKFSGANVDYIPWKRTWEVTMGKSYMEEVQLMQLKLSIPARTSNLIGLSDIRTMPDCWSTASQVTRW
jgi:hypothetical protein